VQEPARLLVFPIANQRFAVELATVDRVARAVAVTPLPGAPPSIRGVVSLHGRIVPVGDLRRRLGLRARAVSVNDTLVLVRTPARLIGLVAEGAVAVADCASGDRAGMARDAARGVSGIARLDDGITLIYELEALLTPDDDRQLEEALRAPG
jgi:purine-binding chemotaxis protein CheW